MPRATLTAGDHEPGTVVDAGGVRPVVGAPGMVVVVVDGAVVGTEPGAVVGRGAPTRAGLSDRRR
jgi:hypothetical protein